MRLGPIYALLATMSSMSLCERRNPDYCDDNLPCDQGQRCDVQNHRCVVPDQIPCSGSAFCPADLPLCEPQTSLCRACLPGEDQQCAARDPATPTCLGPRCVQCVLPIADGGAGSAQTAACTTLAVPGKPPSPICDGQSNTCRPCRLHSECASSVCVKDTLSETYGLPMGSCVPQQQVLVVDPSLCSDTGPVFCTPQQAADRLDPQHRYMVIRRSAQGTDFSEISVGLFANQGVELYIIGPMADAPPASVKTLPPVQIGMASRRGFVINQKSHVTIEGLFIRGSSTGIQCTGAGPGTDTRVQVLRSLLSGNQTALSIHAECHLIMDQSWVGQGSSQGAFAGMAGNGLALDVNGSDFDISNTVLTDNGDARTGVFGGIQVTGGLGGGLTGRTISTLVNSTLYGHVAYITVGESRYTTVFSDTPLGDRLVIMNSLFFEDPSHGQIDHYISPSSGSQLFNLGSDDPLLMGGSNVFVQRGTSPGFRDYAGRDFHLVQSGATNLQRQIQTGGATSATVGTTMIGAPAVDMDGVARPLSSKHVAIGAYEAQ